MSADIAEYYNSSTNRFLQFGDGKKSMAIHRGLWIEQVKTSSEASESHNKLISDYLKMQNQDPKHIVDMGCGVGGTVFGLNKFWPSSRFTGVTISEVQASIALDISAKHKLEKVNFICADFLKIPIDLKVDLAIAIESMIHSDPEKFFISLAKISNTGSRVIIFDDFLSPTFDSSNTRSSSTLSDFKSNWRTPGITTLSHLKEIASTNGFNLEHHKDMTSYIRIGRVRDKLIRRLVPIFKFFKLGPYWKSFIGGDALQQGLKSGDFQHLMVVFKKS